MNTRVLLFILALLLLAGCGETVRNGYNGYWEAYYGYPYSYYGPYYPYGRHYPYRPYSPYYRYGPYGYFPGGGHHDHESFREDHKEGKPRVQERQKGGEPPGVRERPEGKERHEAPERQKRGEPHGVRGRQEGGERHGVREMPQGRGRRGPVMRGRR